MKNDCTTELFCQAGDVPVKIWNSWHNHIQDGKLRNKFKTQNFKSVSSEQASKMSRLFMCRRESYSFKFYLKKIGTLGLSYVFTTEFLKF